MRKLESGASGLHCGKKSILAGPLITVSSALHAYEETGRGVFEDKATKNLFACEHVVNNMRHTKTVGVISEDDVTGFDLIIAEPVGVVPDHTYNQPYFNSNL